jgi:hypothetical protein
MNVLKINGAMLWVINAKTVTRNLKLVFGKDENSSHLIFSNTIKQ